MRPLPARHDAAVGASRQHRAAGNGVPVDRRDQRLRQVEGRVVKPVQRREKLPQIVGAAGAGALQVDAGGKHRPLPGEHDRLGLAAREFGQPRGQRIAEFDVERVRLAMRHGEDGDAAFGFDVHHVRCAPPTSRGASGDGRRVSTRWRRPSACTTAMVSTMIAIAWCAMARGSGTTKMSVKMPSIACSGDGEPQDHRAGGMLARLPGVDRVQAGDQPDRVGEHPVVELHGERVLEQIAPPRRLEPQAARLRDERAVDLRPGVEAHAGVEACDQRAEIDLRQHQHGDEQRAVAHRAARRQSACAAAPAARSTRSRHRSRTPSVR